MLPWSRGGFDPWSEEFCLLPWCSQPRPPHPPKQKTSKQKTKTPNPNKLWMEQLIVGGVFPAWIIGIRMNLSRNCWQLRVVFWRRQWHPTPVLLPGESHGWRRLIGCSPWGHKESDTTGRVHFHALEKEMATHSSVLTWRVPGTAEPGELPSAGLHRVGHDWSDLAELYLSFSRKSDN